MPDSYILVAPGGGTQVDIASFTTAQGADFGTADLLRAAYVEGPHTEGFLAHEETAVRRMSFQLILAASRSIPGLGLEDTEALLRRLARPGAALDLKPQGATTAVRFDVLSGRYDFDYSVHHNREGLRLGRLRLETRPFGYWPTQIILASAASVGLPYGHLSWAGSIIGDAPGLAKLAIQATNASIVTAGVGSWMVDYLGIAITHRASHLSFLHPASLTLLDGASLAGKAAAPASQYLRYAASRYQADWKQITRYTTASAMEPAYRGRYRVHAWVQITPSQAEPWYVAVDAQVGNTGLADAFASYAPIATVPVDAHYRVLDLGEVTLPPVGSGLGGLHRLRLWAAPATSNVGIASPVLEVAGIHLLPLDSDYAGIMPRGLAAPSVAVASAARLMLDAPAGQAIISGRQSDLATAWTYGNAWRHYRGPLPRVASGVRLELVAGSRRTFTGGYRALVDAANPRGVYRFEETAGPTVVDARGSWHGSYVDAPALGAAGEVGRAGDWDGVSDRGFLPSTLRGWATSFTIEAWVKNPLRSDVRSTLLQQGALASAQGLMLYFNTNGQIAFDQFFSGALTDVNAIRNDGRFHQVVWAFDYANGERRIFVDGAMRAGGQLGAPSVTSSGPLWVGVEGAAGPSYHFPGLLDELAIFVGTAHNTDAVRERYEAARGSEPAHVGPAFAAVSVAYQPRFQFVKGL